MQLSCACVLYLLLVADFFNDLFEHHSLSYSVWTVIAGFILLPSVFLNQLKRISWLSMFSVVALVMVYVAVIGFGVVNRYNWNFNLGLTTLEGFPVAWGIILFSFVCHPYLPGNMIVHEYYKGVLRDPSLFITWGVGRGDLGLNKVTFSQFPLCMSLHWSDPPLITFDDFRYPPLRLYFPSKFEWSRPLNPAKVFIDQDSLGLSSTRCGFRIPGTGLGILCQWSLNSRFLVLNIPDSIEKISTVPDFTSKNFPDSRIRLTLHVTKVHFHTRPSTVTTKCYCFWSKVNSKG